MGKSEDVRIAINFNQSPRRDGAALELLYVFDRFSSSYVPTHQLRVALFGSSFRFSLSAANQSTTFPALSSSMEHPSSSATFRSKFKEEMVSLAKNFSCMSSAPISTIPASSTVKYVSSDPTRGTLKREGRVRDVLELEKQRRAGFAAAKDGVTILRFRRKRRL